MWHELSPSMKKIATYAVVLLAVWFASTLVMDLFFSYAETKLGAELGGASKLGAGLGLVPKIVVLGYIVILGEHLLNRKRSKW
jgi:hypothetical protein